MEIVLAVPLFACYLVLRTVAKTYVLEKKLKKEGERRVV